MRAHGPTSSICQKNQSEACLVCVSARPVLDNRRGTDTRIAFDHGHSIRRKFIRHAGLDAFAGRGEPTAMKSKTPAAKRKTPAATRNILVILSNRWAKLEKPRYFEIEADSEGNIHKERRLRSEPREAVYDEVWENDEAKTEIASTNRFHRKYGHKLQKKSKT
jgi:hypothetical protein